MEEPPPPLSVVEEVVEHLHHKVDVHVGYPTIRHEDNEVVMVEIAGSTI
jgi:hypothetical protein